MLTDRPPHRRRRPSPARRSREVPPRSIPEGGILEPGLLGTVRLPIATLT